eukprot:TRINITY_DN1272_c0_g1_i1.p1 TRINITY_DN1272_c0_g1~~TRINITY_DN1272_c0_g1_i1.p1  ORF type:complete len:448 (+),score=156.11 TRINITY_DN1272_c0_g1_i1:661-2004(+)
MIRSQFGVEVRGSLDTNLLAKREADLQPGLGRLSAGLLGEELDKSGEVRCGNWRARPLSLRQRDYAAKDALAGRDILVELVRQSGRQLPSADLHEWCAELTDRKYKAKGGKEKAGAESGKGGKDAKPLSGACPAFESLTKFGEKKIVDKDGRVMMHMRERTVQGLLRRGLATESEDGTIQLKFRPTDHYDYAGLDAAERNACVGCGKQGVARYYIVPRVFFALLPDTAKAYNCHDIVLLCPRCRRTAERPQLTRVADWLRRYGAAQSGGTYANRNAVTPEEVHVRRAAAAILAPPTGKKGSIPPGKTAELRAVVADFYGVDTSDVDAGLLKKAMAIGSGPLPAERLCAEVSADADGLREFLREWRQLFVDALQPQFLAEGWAVDSGLDGRFVPSVASSVEWPGDWRCPSCGVHCFGRNSVCRSCKTVRPDADAAAPEACGAAAGSPS